MLTALFRIWTRVALTSDDNYYSTGSVRGIIEKVLDCNHEVRAITIMF